MKKVNQYSRFAAIDALRAVAALLVVWQHLSEEFIKYPQIAKNGTFLADIASTLDFGRIGIICFFLISGYVIPFSFQKNHSHPLKSFFIRRFFRLYPAYWTSIIAIIFVTFLLTSSKHFSVQIIFANFTMLQSLFQQTHLIGLYWTLQVEIIFYLLVAFLYFLNVSENKKIILTLITIGIMIFVAIESNLFFNGIDPTASKEFRLLPYILSVMFLGTLLRLKHNQETNRFDKFTFIASLMCFGLPLVLLIASFFDIELPKEAFRFGVSHCLGFLLFLLGLKLMKKPPKYILNIGLISYSLYLFHPIVLKIMKLSIEHLPSFLNNFPLIIYLIIGTALSILVAALNYRIIEKPLILIGKQLTNR